MAVESINANGHYSMFNIASYDGLILFDVVSRIKGRTNSDIACNNIDVETAKKIHDLLSEAITTAESHSDGA